MEPTNKIPNEQKDWALVELVDLKERMNHRCGNENFPGVYVNVPNYRQWIDDRI